MPRFANVIASHVLYEVKEDDDGRKKIKARITPHGNRDKEKFNLKTDSATCSPVGIRVLLSCATMFKRTLEKSTLLRRFRNLEQLKEMCTQFHRKNAIPALGFIGYCLALPMA